MNHTLEEILTNLTLGNGDNWTALLLFALYQQQNIAYYCVLIHYEIMVFQLSSLGFQAPL